MCHNSKQNDMKKYCVNKVLCLAFIALAVLTFASCGDDFDFENHYPGAELKKEYAQNWVDLYGAIDPNQNWSMAQDTCVTVTVGASSNVKVYGKFDGIFKLVAQYDNLEGTASIPFSVVKGSEELYVSDGTMAVKTKIGGHVDFSAPATRGAFLPTSNPFKDSFTDSNGQTHTIEFELLDEKLQIEYQPLKSAIGSLANVSPNSTGSNYSNVVVTDFTCVATEGEVIIYPINWINNENKELGIYLNGNKDQRFPLYKTEDDGSYTKMTLSYQLTEGGAITEVDNSGHEGVPSNAKYVYSPGIKITVPVGTVIGFYAVKTTGNGNGNNTKGYSYSEGAEREVATTDVNGTTLVGLYQKVNCSDFLFYAKNVTTITNKLASWYIACEDLGSTGDYDFNDLVFEVSTSSKTDKKGQTNYYYTIKPVAAGGTKKAEFSLDEGKTWTEIHSCFGYGTPDNNGRYTMINTNAEKLALSNGSKGVSGVSLVDQNFWETKYEGKVSDLFAHFKIRVEDNEQAIVIDSPETGTAPQMILTPEGWMWPRERERIEEVYQGFKNWSQNATKEDWNNSVKFPELLYKAP